MGKLYTVDGKLLFGNSELRIGEKIYPVDDRVRTVKKILTMQKQIESRKEDADEMELIDEAIKLGLGPKAFKELNTDELPFKAIQKIFEVLLGAMLGEEPESEDSRFQDIGEKK